LHFITNRNGYDTHIHTERRHGLSTGPWSAEDINVGYLKHSGCRVRVFAGAVKSLDKCGKYSRNDSLRSASN